MRSIAIMLAGVLAGCTTTQERSARMQADMENMIVVYGPACAKLGFVTNSDAWRNCVLQLSVKDDMNRYGYSPHYYAGYGRPYWGGGMWGPYW